MDVGEVVFTFKTDKPFESFNSEEIINFTEIIIIAKLLHSLEESSDEEEDETNEDEEEDEIDEDVIYNGTNELVKIFNQKCVICLDKDSIYAFRNCGHLCLCENCFNSKIAKCIVCRCI